MDNLLMLDSRHPRCFDGAGLTGRGMMSVELTENEVAKSVIVAHGAIHAIIIGLVEREMMPAQRAVEALEMLASGNHHSAETLADSITKLKQLAHLEAKDS